MPIITSDEIVGDRLYIFRGGVIGGTITNPLITIDSSNNKLRFIENTGDSRFIQTYNEETDSFVNTANRGGASAAVAQAINWNGGTEATLLNVNFDKEDIMAIILPL